MKYLKQFVIGSCAIIYLPFWYLTGKYKYRKYSYKYYTLSMPFAIGIWNVISLIIAEYIGLSMRLRFMIISIIHYIGLIILFGAPNLEGKYLGFFLVLAGAFTWSFGTPY